MKSQVLSNFDMQWLTTSAFVIFLVFFICVVLWTFRSGSKGLYQETSQLPLEEGSRHE